MKNYVCKLCGNNTDWDSSVGLENFLVCNWCVHRLAKANKNLGSDFANITRTICLMGEIMANVEDTED